MTREQKVAKVFHLVIVACEPFIFLGAWQKFAPGTPSLEKSCGLEQKRLGNVYL